MYFHRFILREFYRLCAVTEQCECSKLTPPFSFANILDSLALALLSLLLYSLLASCFVRRQMSIVRGVRFVPGPSCCREEHVGGFVGT
jgi:hypothetical protein